MSLMEQYSDIYGIELKEVQEWVNNYANKKNCPESVLEWIEETKEERIKSIKLYIQEQIDNSITMRIKSELIAERIAKSECKIGLHECPF